MEKTRLKPKEDFHLFKQEVQLCVNIKTYDATLFTDERDRLVLRGLCFIKRGFYAPAVASELEKLYER